VPAVNSGGYRIAITTSSAYADMRIETVINDAYDIGCQRLLPNLDEVQTRARAIN
jgi:hypothetical protein